MSPSIDPDKVAQVIRECAAELITPRFKSLVAGDIQTKSGPNDLVTIADQETEVALDKILTAMYPGSVLIGEEGISAGTKTTAPLRDPDQLVWVTDPVDGTWNFVHGNPEFAVMLAAVQGGVVRHGWIYDVPANRMMMVEKGQGAFIEGERLRVAAPKPLSESIGYVGSVYFPKELRPQIAEFRKQVKFLDTLRCAGHEYLRIASGLGDFAVYGRIRPWDHLAGTLAVSEAGGIVRKWDGSAYEPWNEMDGLLISSTSEVYEVISRGLVNKF